MKRTKIFLLAAAAVFVFGVGSANAQVDNSKTTKATPINNGCGSESQDLKGAASRAGANYGGKQVDAVFGGTSVKQQEKSCEQHDKDYYNGVPQKKADDNFQKRSPVMGTAVKVVGGQESYQKAQQERKTS